MTTNTMATQSNPFKHFRWRAMLVRFLVNVVTVFLVVVLVPKVYFVNFSFLNLLLIALVLGILNATIKPVIQFFTLPFIFISYGLIIVLINSFMLWLLSRIFPEVLAVDRVFWALIAGALYGIISSFLESLCGLNEPIIPDDRPDDMALRERVDAEATGGTKAFFETKAADAQVAATLTAAGADAEAATPGVESVPVEYSNPTDAEGVTELDAIGLQDPPAEEDMEA